MKGNKLKLEDINQEFQEEIRNSAEKLYFYLSDYIEEKIIESKKKFQEEIKESGLRIKFLAPPPELCTDNAVGIASCAFFNFSPAPWQKITAGAELEVVT